MYRVQYFDNQSRNFHSDKLYIYLHIYEECMLTCAYRYESIETKGSFTYVTVSITMLCRIA